MEARDIILAPVVTEKSVSVLAEKKYTFKVAKDANKIEIARAVAVARRVADPVLRQVTGVGNSAVIRLRDCVYGRHAHARRKVEACRVGYLKLAVELAEYRTDGASDIHGVIFDIERFA